MNGTFKENKVRTTECLEVHLKNEPSNLSFYCQSRFEEIGTFLASSGFEGIIFQSQLGGTVKNKVGKW